MPTYLKRPIVHAQGVWVTQEQLAEYVRDMNANRAEYVELHKHLSAGGANANLAFRMALGRPRAGELRCLLERKRSRRERLDPHTVLDRVARCATWHGIVRTLITPRTTYHLSVSGPVRQF